MPNILPFDLRLLQNADVQCMSKTQSLSFGRYLYQLQFNPAKCIETSADASWGAAAFWLKGQSMQPNGSKHAQSGFLQELSSYQQWSEQRASFLLPHQILSIAQLPVEIGGAQMHPQALLLPHAPSFFEQDPKSLRSDAIAALIMQAVNALDALAQTGWIHADLKAEHFVVYAGQVKLIDFEQAVMMEAEPPAVMNATPRYMAPELFHGEAKSMQSEIYALGIVLLEWLTGQRLQARSYQDWAYLHCQWLIIDLPEQFEVFLPILQTMLAKKKTLRIRDYYQIKMRLMTEIV
ncbi:protein kinase [Acinetobacter sp.]|jgi:serine/threonine protein kinase|uniref:protein kinase domain-containing protein n=1 Tax=Acinetobacter sp. TaxID=472 RepID=UPI0035B28CB2